MIGFFWDFKMENRNVRKLTIPNARDTPDVGGVEKSMSYENCCNVLFKVTAIQRFWRTDSEHLSLNWIFWCVELKLDGGIGKFVDRVVGQR